MPSFSVFGLNSKQNGCQPFLQFNHWGAENNCKWRSKNGTGGGKICFFYLTSILQAVHPSLFVSLTSSNPFSSVYFKAFHIVLPFIKGLRHMGYSTKYWSFLKKKNSFSRILYSKYSYQKQPLEEFFQVSFLSWHKLWKQTYIGSWFYHLPVCATIHP